MVNFTLESLASEVQLSQLAQVLKTDIPVLTDIDATAVYYVTLTDVKNIFGYQTDSFDTINADNSDVKYFVHYDKFVALGLNPANAMMDVSGLSENAIATMVKDGTPIPSDKNLVAHDFLRHIAKDIFKTHYGVDLFSNEKEVIQDIRSVCSDAALGNVMYGINETVKNVSTISEAVVSGLEGDANAKYMTNANHTSENLTRVLLEQMMGAEKERFAEIVDSSGEQSLPFKADDSINFKLKISAADDQHLLTRSDTPVASRTYKISLVVIADADAADKVNTPAAADEAL